MIPKINSSILNGLSNIHHGFGVRSVDVADYLDDFGVRDRFIFSTNQIHGDRVHCLLRPRKDSILEGDAFITDRPGLVCFVRTADCVPILIADKKHHVVAAVHAGWRGTALNVVGKTLSSMTSVFGSDPKDCVAAIGPRICKNCYEVGEDVFGAVNSSTQNRETLPQFPLPLETMSQSLLPLWEEVRRRGKRVLRYHLDLGAINEQHLLTAGLAQSSIGVINECTYCNDTFASYRRDKSETERQFNFIMIS